MEIDMIYVHKPLHDYAEEIKRDWKKVYFGALPYLEAMYSLNQVHESYGYDTGKSVVLYFLANAHTWRGDTARRIKKELKDIVNSPQIRKVKV